MRTITLTLIMIALMAMTVTAQNEMEIVWWALGENFNDHFGAGVCGGDFNNDGYSDVLIGAFGWPYGSEIIGKNYLYFGSLNFYEEASMVFIGDYHYDSFDRDVSNIKDINGDGVDDLAIPGGVGTSTLNWGGKLELFFTGSNLDTIPDWMTYRVPTEYQEYFGASVDSCGDVNGDGWNDFIVAGGDENIDFEYVEIFHGGPVLDTIPDWRHSTDLQPNYPFEVKGLGDVNADGYDDILAYQMTGTLPGLLFFGGNPMDTIPDLEFHEFIAYASGVGDVNDDGYPDITMNQHFNDSTGFDVVYFGGPDIDNIHDAELLHSNGTHGHSTSFSCGDFNGDGINDITCFSIWVAIHLYVYLGSPWLNGTADVEWTGDYGVIEKVTGVGDVNNDGCDELVVHMHDAGPFDRGKAYLFAGNPDLIDLGAAVEPGDLPNTPGWFVLNQNYPNPFNASTSIHFELGKPSIINMTIYDIQGNNIRNIIENKQLLPGGYNISWTGINEHNQPVSSGIYLLEMQVDQFKDIKKMVLVR